MDHRYPNKSVARMDLQFAPERSSFREADGAMFDKLLAERDRLLADNKALREALELIAEMAAQARGDRGEFADWTQKHARAALAKASHE